MLTLPLVQKESVPGSWQNKQDANKPPANMLANRLASMLANMYLNMLAHLLANMLADMFANI